MNSRSGASMAFWVGMAVICVGMQGVPMALAQTESAGAPAREKSAGEKGSKRRGGRARQRASHKEAEGTKAADRFEADTVIKSQYRYDGEPLEVDPD